RASMRPRPVDAVLLHAADLAEGTPEALRLEHRIVTEAFRAARRPDEMAEHAALEEVLMPIRPGKAERGHEMRLARRRRLSATLAQLVVDARHRGGEILRLPGPARREDAGRAVERVDSKAGVVREARQAGGARRRMRLDGGVLGIG